MKNRFRFKIYSFSPIFFQNIIVSIKGYFLEKKRRFPNLKSILTYSHSNNLNTKQLKNFLVNAYSTPYWNNKFLEFGVNLKADDLIAEIKKLPILTKAEVKENYNQIININVKDKIIYESTSGSTGEALIVPKTLFFSRLQWFVWWRYRYNLGIKLNTWMGWLGSEPNLVDLKINKPPFWRINYVGKQLMFSTYHLNYDTIQFYYTEILKRKITWLHGYANTIYFFASLIRDKKLAPLQLQFITTGGENLMDFQVFVIEKYLGVKPYDHYGQVEGVANFSMLPNRLYQVDNDLAFTEFLPFESLYKVIGTNYNNFAFPLIRYDTNDLVELIEEDNQTYIKTIEGRNEDFIVLPNGTKLGRLSGILEKVTHIKECQIYQKSVYEIIFKIVQSNNYVKESAEIEILKSCYNRIPNNVKITFEYCNSIPKTSRGKLKFILSEIC
jgi:phenylacetate-CoA ligase